MSASGPSGPVPEEGDAGDMLAWLRKVDVASLSTAIESWLLENGVNPRASSKREADGALAGSEQRLGQLLVADAWHE